MEQELDDHKIIGIVSMDLSIYTHDLMVLKLKQCQIDDKIIELIKDDLSNRRQRVKLGNVHSTWQDITAGIPQSSHSWPCFIQYIYERSCLCDKSAATYRLMRMTIRFSLLISILW